MYDDDAEQLAKWVKRREAVRNSPPPTPNRFTKNEKPLIDSLKVICIVSISEDNRIIMQPAAPSPAAYFLIRIEVNRGGMMRMNPHAMRWYDSRHITPKFTIVTDGDKWMRAKPRLDARPDNYHKRFEGYVVKDDMYKIGRTDQATIKKAILKYCKDAGL